MCACNAAYNARVNVYGAYVCMHVCVFVCLRENMRVCNVCVYVCAYNARVSVRACAGDSKHLQQTNTHTYKFGVPSRWWQKGSEA